MVKKGTVTRARVSVEELKKFVTEYQKANSAEEVAKAMGWKLEKVRSQATRLRKHGVPLKNFPRGGNSLSSGDLDSLKKLCGTS